MNVPDGLREELLLERMAAVEHDRKARAFTQSGDYARAIEEAQLGTAAWQRVGELELAAAGCVPQGRRRAAKAPARVPGAAYPRNGSEGRSGPHSGPSGDAAPQPAQGGEADGRL